MGIFYKTFIAAAVVAVVALAGSFLWSQVRSGEPRSDVFTPAHSSISEALGHFFGIRSEPRQPIAFLHNFHVQDLELSCVDCHITVARGPRASIPDVRTCWSCHEFIESESPELATMRSYVEQGRDIPWQRVYGWPEEAHVRFNHAPHVAADIDCSACHGDVASMAVAERAMEHTMGFCLDCHKQRQASIDCLTCHY